MEYGWVVDGVRFPVCPGAGEQLPELSSREGCILAPPLGRLCDIGLGGVEELGWGEAFDESAFAFALTAEKPEV